MNCCSHLFEIDNLTPRTPNGCEECLKIGDRWLHLRLCVTCGHVGCCDDSKNKHAAKHFHSTNYPLIKSFEPGEEWGWCYIDELFLESLPGSLTAAEPRTSKTVVRPGASGTSIMTVTSVRSGRRATVPATTSTGSSRTAPS